MDNNNPFVIATRKQFRFESPVGLLAVEDLWGLPLTSTKSNQPNLDAIAIALNKKLKESSDSTSFVNNTPTVDDDTKLKFDIVIYIIEQKKAENKVKADLEATRARNARIMQLIEQKQDQALADKSIDELRELLSTPA